MALTAGLAVPAAAVEKPLDNGFHMAPVKIRGGGGDVVIAAAHRNVGGRLAICALSWVNGSGTPRGLQREVVSRFFFRIGGSLVRVNPTGFAYVDSESGAMRSQAECSVTATAWTAAISATRLEFGGNFSRPFSR